MGRKTFTSIFDVRTTEDIQKAKNFKEAFEDLMRNKRCSETDFAKEVGLSKDHINKIVNGKENMSELLAFKLEKMSDISYEFWLTLWSNTYK